MVTGAVDVRRPIVHLGGRADDGNGMRTRTMAWYLVVVVAAIAGLSVVPDDTWAQTAVAVGIGYLAVAAIVVGVLRYRPVGRLAWWAFALGLFLNVSGQVVEAVAGRVLRIETFPSVADLCYLGLYPPLLAGLVLLVRLRSERRDWAAVVDAAVITTGLGLLSWVFLIRPATDDPSLSTIGHLVSVAYPVGDILLLATMMRLLLGGGGRNTAFRLITASLGLFLAGDAAWAVINLLGWVPSHLPSYLLNTVFLLAYAVFGAAALHPSMRAVAQPAPAREVRLSPIQLGVLTAASLIAPGLLAAEVANRAVVDGPAIVVGSVVLFLLVVTRMAQLLRQVDAQSRRLAELVRIDELTGLPNRRALVSALPAAIEQASRTGARLTLGVVDLDHFKNFNDEYGHQAGDQLLRGAAAAWTAQLRAVDYLGRHGGEEFLALFPGADVEEAAEVLQRLRAATPAGQSFSAGVATWDGTESADELISRADRALYRAKAFGRRRTVAAPSAAPAEPVTASGEVAPSPAAAR
jgi:diguanylate cyclase (GGDEF)-like protein